MINDIVKNKYISATSDEHGRKIIQFLVENGGNNISLFKGVGGCAYYINSVGDIDSFRVTETPKSYTEMFLPEDEPKDELKRGDLVEEGSAEFLSLIDWIVNGKVNKDGVLVHGTIEKAKEVYSISEKVEASLKEKIQSLSEIV